MGEAEVTSVDTLTYVDTASSLTATVSASSVVDAGSPFLMNHRANSVAQESN